MIEMDNHKFEEGKFKAYFDKEYATGWRAEVKWLEDHGIRSAFVKRIDGIDIYKYTKNVALFASLADFYKERKIF